MDRETAEPHALDVAEELFYSRGIQAVGMDDIRDASGVSLKRLYQLFPAKEQLVTAFLQRRDVRWRQRLADHVDTYGTPDERILAVFDWRYGWSGEPGYRGCACHGHRRHHGITAAGAPRQRGCATPPQ